MIRGLFLNNFKCYQNQDIPFSNLTVLTGANGTGKSTIIQALLLARQSYEKNQEFKQLVLCGNYVDLGKPKNIYSSFPNGKNIDIKISFDEGDLQLQAEYYDTLYSMLSANAISIPSKINNIRLFIQSIFEKKDLEEATIKGLHSSFEFLGADRIIPQNIYLNSLNSFGLGSRGENAIQYLSENLNAPVEENICINKEYDGLALQVSAWLKKMSDNFEVQINALHDNAAYMEYFSTLGKESSPYSPIHVGFGLTYTLPIIIALVKAKPGDLIILENPEAHLHPHAQNVIGELICKTVSCGAQVVVETHSDHIINAIRICAKKNIIDKEQVNFLFSYQCVDDNKVVSRFHIPKMDDMGRFDRIPVGFFDEMDTELFELME